MTCILVTVWHHHTSHRESPGTSLPFHQSQIRRNMIPEIPNKRQQVCIDGKYCSNCKSRRLHTSTLQCFSWLDSYRQKLSSVAGSADLPSLTAWTATAIIYLGHISSCFKYGTCAIKKLFNTNLLFWSILQVYTCQKCNRWLLSRRMNYRLGELC